MFPKSEDVCERDGCDNPKKRKGSRFCSGRCKAAQWVDDNRERHYENNRRWRHGEAVPRPKKEVPPPRSDGLSWQERRQSIIDKYGVG